MDQELKQRLIGAMVITALAAIFVPMLFDDPVDETGKSINELKVPELPAKAQDVEIMPLPEKVEDVAPEPAPQVKAPKLASEEEFAGEEEVPPSKPQPRIAAKDTLATPPVRKLPEAAVKALPGDVDEADAATEDFPVVPAPTRPLEPKPSKPVVKPMPGKPEVAEAAPATVDGVAKPVVAAAATRWYLQVGTFGQKANAIAKQEMLQQQGFASSVKEVQTDKGLVFKVRVGPILDKVKAQAIKARLTQLNVDSFVSADD